MSDTNAPFQEYGTVYGDGVVESFIVVPINAQGFCIRLTSHGYIYEGLAMAVFIDGNYQCNRSRLNLAPPKKGQPSNRTEVDFLLRQQEKPQGDGTYMGRAWRFDSHNIVSEAPEGFQASHFDDLGTIEVLVLRCRARNKEEREYEGSSSGEDSDIFEERPDRNEEDLPAPDIASAPSQHAHASTAVEDELGGMGMVGLFDGANDMHEPDGYGAGHRDRRSGQWVWHQKERPGGLPPDVPPSLYAAPDARFMTTSYVPTGAYRSHHYHNAHHPSQPPKQVRFDFGSSQEARRHQYQHHYPQNSYQQTSQYPERPASRERVRSGNQRGQNGLPPRPVTPPGAPYEPQSVDTNYNNNRRSTIDAHYQGNDHMPWTNEDGTQNNQDTRSDHSRTNIGPIQTPHNEGQSHIYAQGHPAGFREQYSNYSQNTVPYLNQPVHLPPYVHRHGAELPIPSPSSMIPPYAAHLPPIGPAFPPQIILPPSYVHPSTYPYPHWPHYHPGPYAYPEPRHPSTSHGVGEEVSPKNTTIDGVPTNENGPSTSTNNDAWLNGANDTNADTAGAGQDDNWNAAGDISTDNNAAENTWENQNASNDTNNDANDAWNNSNDNNDSNNTAGWDDTIANKDTTPTWGDDNNQSFDNPNPGGDQAAPELLALADAARDLYGPHGPYYSFRALRLDEPKPDAQEEPRYDVPKSLALAKGSTKQVQPGPGYRYYKRRLEPEYIDTMNHPYARFVFKYRTKEQVANEIGITVDVEPSGDQEIQDLQNLDKQALIEMLLRAKTALGGKVPSPPPSPSTPATVSGLGPVAVEAPKLPYLKYSLPPLRPSNFSKRSTPSTSAAGSKTSLVGKENVAPTQNSSNDSWNNSANNSNDFGNGNNDTGWGTTNSPVNANAPNPDSQNDWNLNETRQNSNSSRSKKAPAREEAPDNDVPPRPPTPDNWNKPSTGGGNGDNWNSGQTTDAASGNW